MLTLSACILWHSVNELTNTRAELSLRLFAFILLICIFLAARTGQLGQMEKSLMPYRIPSENVAPKGE